MIRLLTALSSILIPLILLVGLQLSAKKGMFISLIIVFILAILVWDMNLVTIFASILSGVVKSLSIIYILLGAMFLLSILRYSGMIGIMITGFQKLTMDKRLQLIIVGFYFVALLEGAAGFGAPAAIVGPLLYLLGFSPLAAATLALMANAVPMTFGAVGTPLVDGIGTPLEVILGNPMLSADLVNEVSVKAAFVDLFVGSLMPAVMVLLYTSLFSGMKSKRYKFEIIPFALLSGFIYTFLAYLSALFLGPEFGALIGSLLGMVIIVLLIRFRILLPKPKEEITVSDEVTPGELVKAWLPYILVVIFLILTRVYEPLGLLLTYGNLHIDRIFGTTISTKFEFLYSPGFVLLFVALLIILFYRVKKHTVKEAYVETMHSVIKTTLALAPALAMVYIFLNSDLNQGNLPSMPYYLADRLSRVFGEYWVYVAPFIGSLGTFISGSTTTSNIMFTGVQYQVALNNNTAPLIFLVAQALGGNTGCMISVSKVVSACAVVGLNGKESKVMRITLVVALVYALVIGIVVNLLL